MKILCNMNSVMLNLYCYSNFDRKDNLIDCLWFDDCIVFKKYDESILYKYF